MLPDGRCRHGDKPWSPRLTPAPSWQTSSSASQSPRRGRDIQDYFPALEVISAAIRFPGKIFVGGDHLGAVVGWSAERAAFECALLNCPICYRTWRACRFDGSGPVVVVRARTRSLAPAPCTGCGTPSGWCHSRYVRRLGDTSLGDRALLVELSVRRLYCENTACEKVTFAEQVPGLTVRYQRRTPLL